MVGGLDDVCTDGELGPSGSMLPVGRAALIYLGGFAPAGRLDLVAVRALSNPV